MSEYKLFCSIKDNSTPFSVTIGVNETIDDLKELIKNKNAPDLNDINPVKLKLWRAEIPDDQEIDFSSLAPEDELKPTRRINRYWEATPPEEHVHVLVKLLAGKYPIS